VQKPYFRGALPLHRPPSHAKTETVVEDKSKQASPKVQSMEDKMAALSAYRMAKGLCRKCGEKWGEGHRCAESVQLNVLREVWDMFDSVSSGSQINEVEDVSDQFFLAITEAAISVISAPRTLKITCNIQHMDILILIDSGSSHSFISSQLADCLQGITIVAKAVGVRVAN
jgi:hypothetical protein